MIKTTIFGAGGRMGQAVVQALKSEDDIEIAHAVDTPENVGRQVEDTVLESDEHLDQLDADVWVDVSLAAPAYQHALFAESFSIPVLIGATGFDEMHAQRLAELKNAHILAPNLSVGVNLLFDLVRKVREKLGDGYDVGIFDTHHRHKLDAPSGTAKKLASAIEEVQGPVQTASLRIGEVVGEHRVVFASEGEEVELIHRARSRLAFAHGVAPAVRFLHGKKEGRFTMADVLGL